MDKIKHGYIYDHSVQFSNSLNLNEQKQTTSIKAIIITFIFFHYYHQFINNIILSQKSIIHKKTRHWEIWDKKKKE